MGEGKNQNSRDAPGSHEQRQGFRRNRGPVDQREPAAADQRQAQGYRPAPYARHRVQVEQAVNIVGGEGENELREARAEEELEQLQRTRKVVFGWNRQAKNGEKGNQKTQKRTFAKRACRTTSGA